MADVSRGVTGDLIMFADLNQYISFCRLGDHHHGSVCVLEA